MRSYRDHNVSLEMATEIFSSRIGRKMGFPLLEVRGVIYGGKYGLIMDFLPDKADPSVENVEKLREALAFEEWLLNVDMKADHVLAKDGKGYIVDHGHALSTWKPTYFIQRIIHERVTKFDMWGAEDLRSGTEIIDSMPDAEVKDEMEGAFDEVMREAGCKLFTEENMKESVELNMRILTLRKEFLKKSIRMIKEGMYS